MVAKRPARIWWRKHRSVENQLIALALVTEGPFGHFDVFLYAPGPAGTRRIAEDGAVGGPGEAQQRADSLVREILRHECAGCDGWV
jgi:hypothetical protein